MLQKKMYTTVYRTNCEVLFNMIYT